MINHDISPVLNSPIMGYAHHRIILDDGGKPVDYQFVQVNATFEKLTGLKADQILGKTVTAAIPGIENGKFDWIGCYGEVALKGVEKELEQFSEPLKKWFQIHAYSTEKYYFTTIFIDITSVKKQTEELEAFFSVNLDLLCIADFDGNFIKTNEEWSRVLGYSTAELNQKKFLEFVHPDDMEETLKAMAKQAKGEDVLEFTNRYKCKDGSYRYLEWHSHPKGNLIYAAARDVTEKIRDMERLRMREEETASILKSIDDMVFMLDSNFVFKRFHASDADQSIMQPKDFLGKKFQDVGFPEPAFSTILPSLTKTLETGKATSASYYIEMPDGKAWFEARITAVKGLENRPAGLTCVVRNVTERVKQEQDLVLAKEKAEQSDLLKSAFLANMSHEIRTPMNGILGFADLLKEPNLTGSEQKEYIQIIEKSGHRMLNIINDIVDISKIESGMVDLKLSESNINEQIEYIYTFFKPEASTKGIQLSLNNTLTAKNATLTTDREKVYAILTNLIKNAIKYTHAGTIELGCARKGNELEFYVKDTGIGIPKDRQGAIFERFIQSDTQDRMAYQGAGLGLAITKAYVEMLDGKIWLHSEEGKGSTFYFTLPRNTSPEKKNTPQQVEADDLKTDMRELKILIAEDELTSEILLERILKPIAKEILKARNGLEAVEAAEHNQDLDLILMDIRMPGIDGYEATRKIKKFNKKVVIIAQTAHGLAGEKEKAMNAGCHDYIAKPFSKNELIRKIKKHFA